ncbi:MAG: hypothetical protein KF850_20420 [Labilithrix sp.]|nr:hypothetical protein [Labilithrix sp.]
MSKVDPRAARFLPFLLLAAACTASRFDPADDWSASTLSPRGGAGACDDDSPREGCPCARVGANATCGAIHEVVDERVMCAMGTTRCLEDNTWGACESERIVVRSAPSITIAALGSPGNCADPCTPDCTTTLDTPSGLVLPSGLDADAGGLTITPTPPPPNTCTGLTVSPSTAPATNIVMTSMTASASKTFTAALVPAGCNPSAPPPLWYTDKFDTAQMSPTEPGKLTVVVPVAGPVNVSAALGAYTSTVTANISVNVAERGTVNPPPASAQLAQFPAEGAADATDSRLELLYPYSGTIFPMGLPAPLVQWRNASQPADGGVVVTLRYPPTGTAIFQVSQLVSESMTAPVPLRSAQPRYPIPQNIWFAFEQTIHKNRATSGDTGRISVRRRVGSTTYKAKNIDVRIAPGQLKGRVYYNSYGTALVRNYSGALQSTNGAFPSGGFGAATLLIPPGAMSPTVAAGFNGSGGCFVCHSASADGTTLITGNSSSISTRYTFPGTPPNGGISYGTKALNFAGINPTSTRVYTSSGMADADSTSRLLDIAGAVVSGNNAPPNLRAAYPVFSTDNTQVAFTYRAGNASPLSSIAVGAGRALSTMRFDGDRTFSEFRNLVTPADGPAVWPAFLPAGQNGIVYQVETRTTPNGGLGFTRHDIEGSTYYGATGELWWVTTGANPVATRLHRANGYDASGTTGALPVDPPNGHAGVNGTMGPAGAGFYEQRYNYEPSILPQVIGGYSWVMFTSRRSYGNVATINPYASDPRFDNISIDPTTKKLWMTAVSASPTAGTDPSAPAFYFPGQELIAGNSRAVFALDACHPAAASSAVARDANLCDTDLDCCGATSSPATSACVLDPPPLATPPQKHCIATSAGTCRQQGESCLSTSNCCGAANGEVCASGVCTPPPGYYTPQVYTREYTATCLPGYLVRWGHFDWQSRTPSDSSIRFAAQQGDGTSWSPAVPLAFATAQGASVLAPYWATGPTKVSTALGTPKGTQSRKLLITMTFSPSADQGHAPTLFDWRQSIECVPAE